jgi:hypothetical protein
VAQAVRFEQNWKTSISEIVRPDDSRDWERAGSGSKSAAPWLREVAGQAGVDADHALPREWVDP